MEWNGGMDYWNGIVQWPRPRNAARSASWIVKSMIIGPLQGGVTYIGDVHIAATGVKILDRPRISPDLLTTPDLCP